MISLTDKTFLIGGISLFLYFILLPVMKQGLDISDTLGLEKWFLIVGIILIVMGLIIKFVKSKFTK